MEVLSCILKFSLFKIFNCTFAKLVKENMGEIIMKQYEVKLDNRLIDIMDANSILEVFLKYRNEIERSKEVNIIEFGIESEKCIC